MDRTAQFCTYTSRGDQSNERARRELGSLSLLMAAMAPLYSWFLLAVTT
eukprot:COSAG06_NODE_53589_length_299_cov_0.775000_1_plen_48_part_10